MGQAAAGAAAAKEPCLVGTRVVAWSGLEPGDPARMAARIIESVDVQPALVRLVLGSQACPLMPHQYVRSICCVTWPRGARSADRPRRRWPGRESYNVIA